MGVRCLAVGLLLTAALVLPASPLLAQSDAQPSGQAPPPKPKIDPATSPTAATEPPAPQPPQGPQGPQRPQFQDIRYEEDWSVLKDPKLRGDVYDPVKYIANKHGGGYLSLGGELRERVDFWVNPNFGYYPTEKIQAVLNRYMFHADFHAGKHVRLFGQVAGAYEGGKVFPFPTDQDEGELHQGFIEFGNAAGPRQRWTLRLGRQEMAFGQSHFISTSDFYNTRRSYDGVRFQAFKGPLEFNGFLTRPVAIKERGFNDSWDKNQLFAATSVFAPNPFTPGGRVALFYIGLSTAQWQWERGAGRDERHTIGMRMTGQAMAGKGGAVDYTYEVLLQRGKFQDTIPISAWAVTTDTGWTNIRSHHYPRFGLRFNVTSGDAGHGPLGTFQPMFPDNAYSGKIGLIGPSNSIDVTPNLRMAVTPRVFIIPDIAMFWRTKTSDGVYGVVTPYLVTPGGFSSKKRVGTQVSLPMQINIDQHLTYTVAYSHLWAGAFLKDLQPAGKSSTFLTNFMTYKF
jgi:hypothetical protein